MDKQDKALVTETKALIAEVESGDTDHAAWVAIQDRVRQLYEDRTQPEVGELLGKSRRWVQDILGWDAHRGVHSPFARPTNPAKRGKKAEAKRVLSDPETVEEVLMDLPDTTREALHEATRTERSKHIKKLREKADQRDKRREEERGHTARYLDVESHLTNARRYIRKATQSARGVTTFTEEETELMTDTLQDVEVELGVTKLAITGTTDTDWDAEFQKMGDLK